MVRLIPGKTKVRMELFKGLYITDLAVALVFMGLIALVIASGMAWRFYVALGLFLVGGFLLARYNTEPNYIYVLHILRHLCSHRRFAKLYSDEDLKRIKAESAQEVAFDKLFSQDKPHYQVEDGRKHRREEKAAERQYRAELRGQRKADQKLLEDDTISDEEWEAAQARLKEQEAARKLEKHTRREQRGEVYDMAEMIPFTDVADDFIVYDDNYYGAVLEIPSIEFRFFSDYRRNNAIEGGLGRVLRTLPMRYGANIVKLERPVNFNDYRKNEYQKLEALRRSYEQGVLNEEEFKARTEVIYDRLEELTRFCTADKVVAPFYYLVLFDSDRAQLDRQIHTAINTLALAELPSRRLNTRELLIFLKYSNELDFDEDDIDRIDPQDYMTWAMPDSLHIKRNTITVSRIMTHNMRVMRYPTTVGDSWLASVMSIPSTKVVVKCHPVDMQTAVRSIDRSLQELRSQYTSTGLDSKRVELAGHIESLSGMLSMLQNANEIMLETNIYVTAYDIAATRAKAWMEQPGTSLRRSISDFRQLLRRYYREAEMRLGNMEFDQKRAFIGSQISAYDPMVKTGQGIPSNSLAACYPWIFAHISDPGGIKLGSSEGIPTFIDFFRRDTERVNSNMMIVGKSGSGKSFVAKSLLTHLAADNAKIFVLDPENEYTELAENLHGKFINVGNSQSGRLNPFHIITALEDEEDSGAEGSDSYSAHLQFLEEFFLQILPDCDKDAREYLHGLIGRMYARRGITSETDLSRLRPEDYPVFGDLYDMILAEYQSTANDYLRTMLRSLMNHVAKFTGEGRNAKLWNGPSTITTEENFTVFNFQSLLANRNQTVANAQMLLVLKYINNEIIKNREYNEKYGLDRKIVVVIDEAHVFIDENFPVALDFMYQLAKRIRKYNGMQVVITQNIKDFVGSEELARKSGAVINACQYSFIFSLAPNDMRDLCTLYEKAGGINEIEQDRIISAPRGQAFTILSPQSRSTIMVEVPENTEDIFSRRGHLNAYYGTNQQGWEEFLGAESRQKRTEFLAQRRVEQDALQSLESASRSTEVLLEEISEAELALLMLTLENTAASAAQVPETAPVPSEGASSTADAAAAAFAPDSLAQMQAAEKLWGERLGQFAYDTMFQAFCRSLQDGMSRELPQVTASVAAFAAAQAPVVSAPEKAAESRADAEPHTDFDSDTGTGLGSIFNPEAMAESARLDEEAAAAAQMQYQSEQDDGGEAEGYAASYVPLDDFSAGASPETDDEDGKWTDIFDTIMSEVNRLKDTSTIDMMDEFDDEVVEMTLEELIKYVNSHG